MINHLIEKIKQDFCNNNKNLWVGQSYNLIFLLEYSDTINTIIQKNIHISSSKNIMSSFHIKNICIAYCQNICSFTYYKRNLYIHGGEIKTYDFCDL